MKLSAYLLLIMATAALNISCFKDSDSFGKVNAVSGDASVYSQKNGEWNPVKKSQTISYGDTIKSKNSIVDIIFRNKSKLTLEPNSKIVILDSSNKKSDYIFPVVYSGGILSDIKHKKPNDFQYIVYTPVSYVQPQGSCFYVSYNPSTNKSDVYAYNGNVIVYNSTDFSVPVQLEPGFTTLVVYTDAPSKPVRLTYNQFRRIGYMFPPEVSAEYAVTFGFPAIPIPVPLPLMMPPQVETIIETSGPQQVIYEERPQHRHVNPPPRSRSNVSVNVNINANGGFPMPGLPMPVPVPGIPFPAPVPRHHGGFHRPGAPAPVMAPIPGPFMAPHAPRHMAPGPGPVMTPHVPGHMAPGPGPLHGNHGQQHSDHQNYQQNNNQNNNNQPQQNNNNQQHSSHRGPRPPLPGPVPGPHMFGR